MTFANSRVRLSRLAFSASPRCLNNFLNYPPVGFTRLAPSKRVPGAMGVFCTRPLKKFTPVGVLPDALRGMPSSRITQLAPLLDESAVRALAGSASTSPEAAPFLENLIRSPRKKVSLRRFLALRAAFSSGSYFYVATAGGWYLIVPSKAVGLRGSDGLKAWLRRRHHRYLNESLPVEKQEKGGESEEGKGSDTLHAAACVRRKKAAELHRMEHEQEDVNEMGVEEVSMRKGDALSTDLALQENHSEGVGGEFERLGDVDVLTENIATSSSHGSPSRPTKRNREVVHYITEEHLFQINDGVPWQLPPSEDLAQPEYWEHHRGRMALYQDTDKDATSNGLKREEIIQQALRGLRTPPAESMIDPTVEPIQSESAVMKMREQQQHIRDLLSEREALAHGEKLFQILTQKANVTLHVDDESGLLTLTPIVNLRPGDELLLHYGWEWWTHRLLSTLLLAVEDAEMHSIRWIELLCRSEDETDVFEFFPRLLPVRKGRKRGAKGNSHGQTSTTDSNGEVVEKRISSSSSTEEVDNKEARSASPVRGKYILYNERTKKEATDAAVLIFAIRRSCQDPAFFKLLLRGSGEDEASYFPPVFDQDSCDVEVPISEIRRALLRTLLRSSQTIIPEEGGDSVPREPDTVVEEDEEEGERFHV